MEILVGSRGLVLYPYATVPQTYFQKGFGLAAEVGPALARSYQSPVVERLRGVGSDAPAGEVRMKLAREFGFCYGVDRAVDYAYQARKRFPDRQVVLTGEIIHNPHVNDQLRSLGIRFLSDEGESLEALTPDEVVILPAFGVTIELLQQLSVRGCTLV